MENRYTEKGTLTNGTSFELEIEGSFSHKDYELLSARLKLLADAVEYDAEKELLNSPTVAGHSEEKLEAVKLYEEIRKDTIPEMEPQSADECREEDTDDPTKKVTCKRPSKKRENYEL